MLTIAKTTHPPYLSTRSVVIIEDHSRGEYYVSINSWTVSKAEILATLDRVKKMGYIIMPGDEYPTQIIGMGWVRVWLTTDRWEMMC